MNTPVLNRRRFLALAGVTVGAATLSCARLSGSGSPQPAPPKTDFVESSYGEESNMNGKILVAYASQSGSTAGVADAVARQLAAEGAAVDVRLVKNVTGLSEYRSVVLGSAVNNGKWMPEAATFVQAHQEELNRMPTAFFLVCMMAAKDTEQNRKWVAQFLEPERALVTPVAEGRFAGAFWPEKYPFSTALGLRIYGAYLGLKPGDYRDWEAIRSWADSTRPLL